MELEKVILFNFRSIKYVSIDFNHKCRILVGINESGKTNILKALSLLSEEAPISKDDIREPLPNETEINLPQEESGWDTRPQRHHQAGHQRIAAHNNVFNVVSVQQCEQISEVRLHFHRIAFADSPLLLPAPRVSYLTNRPSCSREDGSPLDSSWLPPF